MRKWVTNSGYIIYQILSGRSNVFLLNNGKENILVDTSTKGNYKKLTKIMDSLGCNEYNLVSLIITHAHNDHAANASKIREKYKTKIIIHRNDADFLKQGSNPLPKGTVPYAKYYVSIFGKKLAPFFKYEPSLYDVVIEEKYDLKDFGFNAYIVHTPGHTSGSVSVIVDEEIAIVGDAMFGVYKKSVFPPFADDKVMMIKSWGNLLDTGCKIFIPAHGTENTRELLNLQYKKYKSVYSI